MKSFNKICIVLILLIFTMGFVASANVHDFKYPNTFKKWKMETDISMTLVRAW